MNTKRKYSLVVLCMALVRIVLAELPQGILLDKIIANVDNQIILQSDLETIYQQYLLQGGEEVPDLKCQILGQLIATKILLSKARQEEVVVEKEVIERVSKWIQKAAYVPSKYRM